MLEFKLTPYALEHGVDLEGATGFIPFFLDPTFDGTAVEQIDRHYSHGGGWRPFPGFIMNPDTLTMTYPGDPPYHALATAEIGEERIIVFQFAWVAVVQKDGTYKVARID